MEQFTVRKENPLEYKPIGLLLVEFAVPATIAVLVNAVYNIVDQIFIGQGVGLPGKCGYHRILPCHDNRYGLCHLNRVGRKRLCGN